MRKLIVVTLFLQSCTVSLIVTNTHGTAEDVVDSAPQTEANPDITIPALPTA